MPDQAIYIYIYIFFFDECRSSVIHRTGITVLLKIDETKRFDTLTHREVSQPWCPWHILAKFKQRDGRRGFLDFRARQNRRSTGKVEKKVMSALKRNAELTRC